MAHTTITLSIDDDISDRVLEAVSSNHGYTEEVRNPDHSVSGPDDEESNPVYIPNPQTRLEFVTEWLRRKLISEVAKCERRKASKAANVAVAAEINIA
jgi:hypothetical protein